MIEARVLALLGTTALVLVVGSVLLEGRLRRRRVLRRLNRLRPPAEVRQGFDTTVGPATDHAAPDLGVRRPAEPRQWEALARAEHGEHPPAVPSPAPPSADPPAVALAADAPAPDAESGTARTLALRVARAASDGIGLWLCPVAVGGVALAVAGPVAAVTAAAYTSGGLRALRRQRRAVAGRERERRALDRLSDAASALRAGHPPLGLGAADDTRLGVAIRLAERTGAPVVELVERIEADLRATARLRAAAGAQSAGARATALLLAALPAGGIALGYGMGVDPAAVLLHTPLGAACAAGALLLQLSGLAWSRRIVETAAVPR
ncbi:hypothetical protein GCM10010124_11650 [Pilimelia terevasa]|uniref:Tight adherence protein B n=1 Tax=Pilimelia terevasa TaxID=53372 RepID=A0A8J3BHV9_9ACTN|nr:hypothetical protein [Pilimelia terevasa]GGK20779.1 hypothetical protein GCM10010124_11650 [Pilimelia terevasa]